MILKAVDVGGNAGSTIIRNAISGIQIVNATQGDADGDGLDDAWEITFGLDPDDNGLDGSGNPIPGNPNGAAGDPDMDGSPNLREFTQKSFPDRDDSDGDTLLDGVETGGGVFVDLTDRGTSPIKADSDGDILNDNIESNTGVVVDPLTDSGTNPNLSDSDGDNLRDDWELANGFNPLSDGDNTLTGGGIGLNFGAGRAAAAFLADDVAGVFPQANWNNLAGAVVGPLALTDDAGADTEAMASVEMNEEWSVAGPAADPNGVLLTGWFAAQNDDGTKMIDITEIPYANYDPVRYFNHDRTGETADVSEANEAFPLFTVRENDSDPLVAITLAQQVESNALPNDDHGNFAIIAGLSSPNLNLIVDGGTLGADRGPLSGIQLVSRGNLAIVITSMVVNRAAGTVDPTWTSQTGRRYLLDGSSGLTGTDWLELADDIAATGPAPTHRLSGIDFTAEDRRFFRIRLSQCSSSLSDLGDSRGVRSVML